MKKDFFFIFWLLLGALGIRFLLIFTPAHVDIQNHVDWGIRFWQYGPKDFYEQIFWGFSWPNQPIGSILLFALIAKLNQWLFSLIWYLNILFPLFPSGLATWAEGNLHHFLLKLPSVLADIGMGLLIYQIVLKLSKKEQLGILGATFFLFNPALIYNSTVWGQIDSLVNFLAILGLWLAYRGRLFFGLFSYLSSLYFKLSPIIFFPLMLLILWQKRYRWQKILAYFLPVAGCWLVVTLPFVHHGNVFSWLWYLYTNRVLPRQGEMLSGNAFNLWTLLFGVDLSLKESLSVFGVEAKTAGRFLFLSITLIATVFYFLKRKLSRFTDLAGLGVIYAFAAFLFLTNMHERYLYPVFPLLAVVVGIAPRKPKLVKLYVFLSVIYVLNLYNLWWWPLFSPLVTALTAYGAMLPRLLSLFMICLFVLVVRSLVADEKNAR